jgi:hypothetical protein
MNTYPLYATGLHNINGVNVDEKFVENMKTFGWVTPKGLHKNVQILGAKK